MKALAHFEMIGDYVPPGRERVIETRAAIFYKMMTDSFTIFTCQKFANPRLITPCQNISVGVSF